MKAVIDDIVQYDSIYRSDGPDYARYRKYFLENSQKQLNRNFRENTYLPLRILLLETTRKQSKHSLNDLLTMLRMERKKNGETQVVQLEAEVISWHQISEPIQSPGPISDLHLAPSSGDYFAFSTIDGHIHFAKVVGLQLQIVANVTVPFVSFLKFQWVNRNLIVGIGFTKSVYIMSSDARLWELQLPSEPSEIAIYQDIPNCCLVGDRSGNVLMFDLSELAKSCKPSDFHQPTTAVISRTEADIVKITNLKKPITAISSPEGSHCIVVGTSDGDVTLIGVEERVVRRRRVMKNELKMTTIQRVALSTFIRGVKPSSIDSVSAITIKDNLYIIVNTRSENAALLVSSNIAEECSLVKQFRVPSMRAKCPSAINYANGAWMWVAGSDMGDVILNEQGEEVTVVTLGESAISALEWVRNSQAFISADVSGMLTIWTKGVE